MNCWQCGADIKAGDLFCASCETLQPPDPRRDHFARLRLEPRFELSVDDVTRAHRALQRQLHPDRFVSETDRVRRSSLEHATLLNDAVRVLRDPVRRGAYLLSLRGLDPDSEDTKIRLDPLFLMEIIELREAVSELDGSDAHVERGRMEREVAARFESLVAQLAAGLDDPDAPPEPLAQLVAQLKYLRRVLDELHAQEAE
jgi:molecular chaperone HscB